MVLANRLANRVSDLTPAATLTIAAKAKEMQAAGISVCSFSTGEPDFDTPAHIKAAAIDALQQGQTKYGPVAGLPQLRQAIATKLQHENHLTYSPSQIMISNGGKQTLLNLFMILLDPGDEVIIPIPYWVSYPEMAKLASAKPVLVQTSAADGFKLTAEQLKAAITPNTKLIVLNSPNNPTGSVYQRDEWEALAEVILQHSCYVVSDEIYEKLIYDGATHVSFATVHPALQDRTILSSGFAKAYAMTGWRIGYLAGPQDLIDAAISFQSHSTSNVCTFAQYGALAALQDPVSETRVAQMRETFAQRRRIMLDRLSAIPGIECTKPMGAFYLWFSIAQMGLNSVEFCTRLLEQHQVAAIPGIAFGADDYVRLSYATDLATIEEGLRRIEAFVRSL